MYEVFYSPSHKSPASEARTRLCEHGESSTLDGEGSYRQASSEWRGDLLDEAGSQIIFAGNAGDLSFSVAL